MRGKELVPSMLLQPVCTHNYIFNVFSVDLQPAYDFLDVCIGDGLEVTCTADTPTLSWEINGVMQIFTRVSMVNTVILVGDVELMLLSTGQELVSTATLNNINPIHNRTVLTCLNVLNPLPEEMVNITIIVQGKGITMAHASLTTL